MPEHNQEPSSVSSTTGETETTKTDTDTLTHPPTHTGATRVRTANQPSPMSLHQGSRAVSDSVSVLRPARAPLIHWEGKSKGDGMGREGEREFLGTFSSCLVAFPPALHTPVPMPSVLSSQPREREEAYSPRSVQPTEQVVGSRGSHSQIKACAGSVSARRTPRGPCGLC